MIVSTWQFLQKEVRGGSIGRVAKGVKTRRCAKKLLSEREPFVMTEIPRFSVLPLLARLPEDRLNRRSAFFENFVASFP
jgi:hypothetical protein